MLETKLSRFTHALDSILSATISAGFTAVLIYMLVQSTGLID